MPVLLIGMLDERAEVLHLMRRLMEERGHRVILADISIGTGGIASTLKPEFASKEILAEGGIGQKEIHGLLLRERNRLVSAMASGLARKVSSLTDKGELDGIVAVCGLTGALISLEAMKVAPFGLPKLLVSSACALPAYAERLAEYLVTSDITVMHTVIDTVGANRLVRSIAFNAANAICGMIERRPPPEDEERPLIALTEFGFCERAAIHLREMLKDRYEVVSFHAQGWGDRAACELVRQGLFHAFIDLVPAGFSEHLLGGNRMAGPDRLEATKDLPIPYILTPCGFDMISCGPYERRDRHDPLWTSRRLSERKLFVQDRMRVQARTSQEEMEEIAQKVAERLNGLKYKELVKFVIPERGFSSLSVKGGPLYDPLSDRAFIETLGKCLSLEIEIVRVKAQANSRAFAKAIVRALQRALRKKVESASETRISGRPSS